MPGGAGAGPFPGLLSPHPVCSGPVPAFGESLLCAPRNPTALSAPLGPQMRAFLSWTSKAYMCVHVHVCGVYARMCCVYMHGHCACAQVHALMYVEYAHACVSCACVWTTQACCMYTCVACACMCYVHLCACMRAHMHAHIVLCVHVHTYMCSVRVRTRVHGMCAGACIHVVRACVL